MNTPDLIFIAFCLAPILIFIICLCVCIRQRNFLSGSGALAGFLLGLYLAHYASGHLRSPYQYIAMGLLAAGYLYLFFIRPFKDGLKGKK
jgi:uncharacterized membrane protein YccC